MPRWKNLMTTIVLCILVTYTLFVTGTKIFHSLQRREIITVRGRSYVLRLQKY
jgi:hypothetical protein